MTHPPPAPSNDLIPIPLPPPAHIHQQPQVHALPDGRDTRLRSESHRLRPEGLCSGGGTLSTTNALFTWRTRHNRVVVLLWDAGGGGVRVIYERARPTQLIVLEIILRFKPQRCSVLRLSQRALSNGAACHGPRVLLNHRGGGGGSGSPPPPRPDHPPKTRKKFPLGKK